MATFITLLIPQTRIDRVYSPEYYFVRHKGLKGLASDANELLRLRLQGLWYSYY